MQRPRFLKRIPLFRGLSGRDLLTLARIAEIREFKKGETIFSKATRGDTLYAVVKGRVKIFSKSRTGRTKTFAYLESRDFFGEMALLEEAERSAGAVALVPSTLITLRRKSFQSLLRRRPQLAMVLFRTLCERLRRADREIESLTFNNVLGRIAKILIDLSKRYGKPGADGRVKIGLGLSHKELADMAGTAREIVTRVLTRFHRLGCIETDGQFITLTNVAKLREWIY